MALGRMREKMPINYLPLKNRYLINGGLKLAYGSMTQAAKPFVIPLQASKGLYK